MGMLIELDTGWTPPPSIRRPPAPVRHLRAAELHDGRLWLTWEPPARHAPVTGYRIERTREGRHYELLGETADTSFHMPRPALRDPWFYRVTAFNLRGAGRAKMAWFYERRPRRWRPGRTDPRMSLSLPFPVAPGLRVQITEPA